MYYEKSTTSFDTCGFGYARTFASHFHGAVEMIYVISGNLEVIIDGRCEKMGEGGISLAFPYQSHEYHTDEEVESLRVIAHPENLPTLERIFRTKLPNSPVGHYDERERQAIEAIINAFRAVLRPYRVNPKTIPLDTDPCLVPLIEALISLHLSHVGITDVNNMRGDLPLVMKALRLMEEKHTDHEYSLSDAAQSLGVTQPYLSNIVKQHTGCTMTQLLHTMRTAHARILLETTSDTISDIAMSSGFSSLRTFNRVFMSLMGMTPREYKSRK